MVVTVQSEVLESLACDSITPASGGFGVRRTSVQQARHPSLLSLFIMSDCLPSERTLFYIYMHLLC